MMAKKQTPAYVLDTNVIIGYLFPDKEDVKYRENVTDLFRKYKSKELDLYVPACVQAEIGSADFFANKFQKEKLEPLKSEEAKRRLDDFLKTFNLLVLDEDRRMSFLANDFSKHLGLSGIDALILAATNMVHQDGLAIDALYTFDKGILAATENKEIYESLGGNVPAMKVPDAELILLQGWVESI